jgi:hypothetical protein
VSGGVTPGATIKQRTDDKQINELNTETK